jgi:hypothetical protein
MPAGEARVSGPGLFHLPPGARWAVDPAKPGADLPSQGQSLFDRVFADGNGGHHVPFPFDNVLDVLERAVGAPAGSRLGLATALIPIGRSLQRSAAAPDFFRYPRLVVAVDGEPAQRSRAHFLKDRLFLGYHEKAQVIEVISYNERAARFEYQVVSDYTAGRSPQVHYANRALCVSCHQNQAPIFPRAAWDETNANRHVAQRLREHRSTFYGVTALADGTLAARFDNATDRANLLSALQFLWRKGCGSDDESAIRCRAAALIAMMQHRLSAASGYERDPAIFRAHFADTFDRQWARLSPAGLAIPEADLLNREPLLEPVPTEIDAHLDPLTARAPVIIWDRRQAKRRLITELAQSLPQADLTAVDAHLAAMAQRETVAWYDTSVPCTVLASAGAGRRQLLRVECGSDTATMQSMASNSEVVAQSNGRRGAETFQTPIYQASTYQASTYRAATRQATSNAVTFDAAAGTAPQLVMELHVDSNRVVDGFVSRVTLPGGERFERIRASAGTVEVESGGARWLLVQLRQRNGWSLRDHRGHALAPIALRWQTSAASAVGRQTGEAQLRMVDDFSLLRSAVRSLADAAIAGQTRAASVLGDGAFIPSHVSRVDRSLAVFAAGNAKLVL